jgi:GNAT superfamily N-acetyltransferase
VAQPSDHDVILNRLISFNAAAAGPSGYETVAILLRNEAEQTTVGGLWGVLSYDWLFIELLFVPEEFRRQKLGEELVRAAEGLADQRKCVGVWLDTFGFQALGFYKNLGYQVFGELPNHPRGSGRFFLRKLL